MITFGQLPALAHFFRNYMKTKVAMTSGFRVDPAPFILIWESNNRCNARCSYCDFWRKDAENEEILDEGEIRDLINQAAALGVCCFSISGGGDPLMREDIGRNIEYCKKKGLTVAVTTNGLLIDSKRSQDLLKADVVTISMDSLDEEKNNRRRGVRNYLQRSLDGLKTLVRQNKNTYLCVQSVLDEENWMEINDINQYFFKMGIDTLFQPRYNHAFYIPRDEWKERIRRLRYRSFLTRGLLKRFMDFFPQIADGSWKGGCLAGSVSMVISAKGELLACHLNKDFSKDLRKTSLESAWKDMKAIRSKLLRPERDCICGDTAIFPYSMLLLPITRK